MSRQPRIFRNDWSVLTPPDLGDWTPTLSVSVVIPAHQAHRTLPHTLASLACQSYPAHLLEVVVVDDGSTPPVELPALRPDTTRLVTTEGSWGRAHACRQGAEVAEGDVIHWFDADMVAFREEVEAQLRWHHLCDHAVALGHKTFVDPDEGLPTVEETHAAVAEGRAGGLFTNRWTAPHDWVEEYWAERDELTKARWRGYFVHTGATASVRRELYRASGGMDSAMKLGEDIELGYRLQMLGAVFVPDRQAASWHLGRTQIMQRLDEVNRYNNAFFADRVPDLRYVRRDTGRSWTVPYFDVVVDATGHTYEEVKFTVDGILAAPPHDLRVNVVGPWDRLTDERRSPLADPVADARMLQADLGADPRVRLVTEPPASSYPAMFQVTHPVGWAPGPDGFLALRELLRRGHGLLSVLMPDGSVARFERVAAAERVARLIRPGEDRDDLLDAIAGSWWCEGLDEGFTHVSEQPEPAAGDSDTPPPLRLSGARTRAALQERHAPQAAPPPPRLRVRDLPRAWRRR